MTRTKLSLIIASLAVATGLFWAKILIAPPVTMAAPHQGIDAGRFEATARRDLPSFDDTYQRHIGVLDSLKAAP
jgi:hypothetical protein